MTCSDGPNYDTRRVPGSEIDTGAAGWQEAIGGKVMNASDLPLKTVAERIVPVQPSSEKRLHPGTTKHGLGRLSADLVGRFSRTHMRHDLETWPGHVSDGAVC